MCMATLDRRVQLLLDPSQYEALEQEAAARQQSVAAIVREAITRHLGIDGAKRRASLDQLFASAAAGADMPMSEWVDIKQEIEQDLYGREQP